MIEESEIPAYTDKVLMREVESLLRDIENDILHPEKVASPHLALRKVNRLRGSIHVVFRRWKGEVASPPEPPAPPVEPPDPPSEVIKEGQTVQEEMQKPAPIGERRFAVILEDILSVLREIEKHTRN